MLYVDSPENLKSETCIIHFSTLPCLCKLIRHSNQDRYYIQTETMTLSAKEEEIVIPSSSVIVEGQPQASAPPIDLSSTAIAAVAVPGSDTKPVSASAKPTVQSPPGAPEGGVWGTVKYVGETTKMIACLSCLCCGCLGCCVLLCPQDEKDAYAKNGKIWDAAGGYIGPASDNSFAPSRNQQMKR